MTFLTTAEVAVRLGISQRLVSRLIKQGRIKATPLGRALRGNGSQPAIWMIEEKEVEVFKAAPRRKPGRPAGSKTKPKDVEVAEPIQEEPKPSKLTAYQEMMARRKKG